MSTNSVASTNSLCHVNTSATNASQSNLIHYVPEDKIFKIFSYLKLTDLENCRWTCKDWCQITGDEQLLRISVLKHAFGGDHWKRYFGDPGDVPPLPRDMYKILLSPCPFWNSSSSEAVRVLDTHMLSLIPATVDGEGLSLNKLRDLIQNPKSDGHPSNYRKFTIQREHGSTLVEQSHWVLMTKDIIPGNKCEIYNDQNLLVNQYRKQDYISPGALEAATCILNEHVSSGTRLFDYNPLNDFSFTRGRLTFTYCNELVEGRVPVIVGGFGCQGLDVSDYLYPDSDGGVALLRKF